MQTMAPSLQRKHSLSNDIVTKRQRCNKCSGEYGVVRNDTSEKKDQCQTAFRAKSASDAACLTDGIRLSLPSTDVSNDSGNSQRRVKILPWLGYGTYKIKSSKVFECTLNAIRQGYRCVDTAFVYGGETTERQVGQAIQDAIREGSIARREDMFVITKQWRKFHGYDPTLKCLRMSLKRLQLEYIDLWLMHWPGPAYSTMNRRNDMIQQHGPWYYAVQEEQSMPHIRSETWRAMEDAYFSGKVHAIGLSNCTVSHMETLKKTARVWPPAVLQIECHPLFPQTELIKYCHREGIAVQAYASLGGQDASRSYWNKLYPTVSSKKRIIRTKGKMVNSSNNETSNTADGDRVGDATANLCTTPPVQQLAYELGKTPGQILLRWALDQSCAVIPKTEHVHRMVENSQVFEFTLTSMQIENLTGQLQHRLSQQMLPKQEEPTSRDVADECEKITNNIARIEERSCDDETIHSSDQQPQRMMNPNNKLEELGRLCWKRDPLRMLNFE